MPFRRQTSASATLSSLLEEAKAGAKPAREQLLRDYLPFVEKVACATCKRAIGRTDDEFQIALLAMNEAIDAYQIERGSFVGFAETVIRRRLIDSFRMNQRAREVPFTSFDEEDEEGNVQNAVELGAALRDYGEQEEARERAEEIAAYSRELEMYGLTFRDLVAQSPKHVDAREHAIAVARLIAEDTELRQQFRRHRTLPLKQLTGRVAVSRKTLERQRGYIVAVAVLLLGDYERLRAFVQGG
jgi:RNA polymerase sigma factor